MSLEELLKNKIIRRIKPNPKLALMAIGRAKRDTNTAKTLIENEKFDWALAVAYNAMLQAGRALMFGQGYRPSSTEGHVAVMRFLRASLGGEVGDRMIMVMNGMRKKRHRVIYEEMDIVSEDEARRAVEWAEEFADKAERIIRQMKISCNSL